MKRRTIVYIAQSAGGVAEYLYMFLKNFDDEGIENILIVSQDYENQIERFKPYVKDIFIVPMVREINIKSDVKAIMKLKRILKVLKPDVVYLHSSKAGAVGRITLLLNSKIKIIYNAHGWYFNAKMGNLKRKIFTLIEKILAIKTDVIVNISKNEYDSAIKYKIASKEKMCIIENGIDFEKYNNLDECRSIKRKSYGISDNNIIIGIVGRLSEQKDPMTSIKAFRKIKEEIPNAKMMFVGSGELEREILEYSKNNNIEKDIIITGWVSDVEKYIPVFDIAILPSKWEGFGLAIVEYMICGKPIVASNVGGISNIIENGKNGFLVEKEKPDELAKKIIYLINNKIVADEFVKNNKTNVKKFDIKRVIKEHKNIIMKIN